MLPTERIKSATSPNARKVRPRRYLHNGERNTIVDIVTTENISSQPGILFIEIIIGFAKLGK